MRREPRRRLHQVIPDEPARAGDPSCLHERENRKEERRIKSKVAVIRTDSIQTLVSEETIPSLNAKDLWRASGSIFRKSLSIHQSPGQPIVSVNPPVAQEGPVGAGDIHFAQVNRHNEVLLFPCAGFGEDFAGGARDEALSPEFNAIAIHRFFQTDAIGYRDITAVGDGVRALDRFPLAVLYLAVFFFLTRMPADGGRVKENLRALQRGQARRFGIPLVPANADTNFRVTRLPLAEAQIARREIE